MNNQKTNIVMYMQLQRRISGVHICQYITKCGQLG